VLAGGTRNQRDHVPGTVLKALGRRRHCRTKIAGDGHPDLVGAQQWRECAEQQRCQRQGRPKAQVHEVSSGYYESVVFDPDGKRIEITV
jgi:hypothetical protein